MADERTQKYVDTLAKMIRCETVSVYGYIDEEKFKKFHELLKELFPNIFAVSEIEYFSGSLLIKWKGKGSDKLPVLFMNHHDVVEAVGDWKHKPFGGEVSEGKLWGRGTLDTKGGLFGMLQAADELVAEGFTPDRDIYFESSCTEETTGFGANTISKELEKRGIRFDFILDEGGMIVEEPIAGVKGFYAMVGMGEKGCADLKFIARSNGGHASTPGKNTPLVRLGKFMAEVEKSNIFVSEMSPTIKEMLTRLAPAMSGALKVVCSNASLFKPLIKAVVPSVSAVAGALFKTTLAFTTAKGSEGLNVLPQEAYVTGNMRYSHHQGGENSINAVRKIAKKYDIEVEVIDGGFQSNIADYNSDAFKLVEKAVSAVYPDVKTVPYIMTAASDCRFFSRNSDNCFRFLPFKISDEQMASIHGYDESVDIDTLAPAVDFYRYIMKTL
ncbi:MAG: M20/M25/M40 family metallo-hydrolase [Clostridia bacterium]|nr:M20/M25/M40 family metallo-hydrolase [Clostridia bacterium]